MRVYAGVISLMAVCAIVLSGCGPTNQAKSKGELNTVNSTQVSPSASNLKGDIMNMISTATELKKVIAAGDSRQVNAIGPKLESTWRTFEDSIKPKYPNLYANVEQYLDPTVAGSAATSLDQQTLAKLNDQLIQALDKLLQKVSE